jgi:predicted AlkP superfamily pyrophosphatase or phosphodiesterase
VRLFFTISALLFLACGAPGGGGPGEPEPAPERERPYVVMVSFDGMRHDFLDRAATPNFQRVAREGVRAAALIPSYPSKTFPNHYTMATGLYPAKHGIVDNAFYDPEFEATYRLGDPDKVRDGRWYSGEPIWVTAESQGIKAASFFWVGTEAAVRGIRPSYFKYYDRDFPHAARVDTVLHWLSLPLEERPRLVMLYFSEPDATAHRHGPDDPAVAETVAELDALLGRLLDGIEALPIAEAVHVVLVSDHGMMPVPPDRVVYLDDYVDLDGIRVVDTLTQALLYFDGAEERRWAVHEALAERLEHARVFFQGETPPEWHSADSRRIGDLLVVADPGWVIMRRDGRSWSGGGMHGWDPAVPQMGGIFLAAGPALAPGRELPTFENVHIYPLLAHLLGLDPADGIDGRLDASAPFLLAPVAR